VKKRIMLQHQTIRILTELNAIAGADYDRITNYSRDQPGCHTLDTACRNTAGCPVTK